MSVIVSLSPWSTFWSMGKGGGTPSELVAIQCLQKINPQVLHFVEDDSPLDEGNIPISVHLEKRGVRLQRVLRRLGPVMQRGLFELRARKWKQYNYKFFVRVLAELRKRNIDSVDLVFCSSSLLVECGRRLGFVFKCPVVAYFYGTFLASCIGKQDAYWQHAEEYLGWTTPVDLRICLNDGTKGIEVARDLALPMEKFLFQPHGLDRHELNSDVDTVLTKELISENMIYVMTASRLASWKRVDRLLLAIPNVVQRIKNVRFLILGDGPEREKLEHLSKELDISDWIRFVGSVPQEIVFAFMRKCDVFVSTNDFSNLSGGVKQAMYLGMCVVATDSGDTKTLIKDDDTGKLVSPEDKTALAKSLIEILLQPEVRHRLGRSAKTFIEAQEPNQDVIIGERIAVLQSLISSYKQV